MLELVYRRKAHGLRSSLRLLMGLEWLGLALTAAVLNGFSVLAAKPSADRLGPWVMWLGAILIEGIAFLVAGLLFPRRPGTADARVVLAPPSRSGPTP